MRRRNGGFLELLSLLFVYGVVSCIMQRRRGYGVFMTYAAERAIETIVAMVNIVVMLIAMCVCIYQMGAFFGIIMGVVSCLGIFCLGQMVAFMVEIKLSESNWKLWYFFMFLFIGVIYIPIKSIALMLSIYAFIVTEILIVNFILNKYRKKQSADIGTAAIDNNAADNNDGKTGECGSQPFRVKKGVLWVPDDGVADLLRGVSLSERMRYLNVDSVGELIEKFPTCIDEYDVADFREGERSIMRAKRRVVPDKYRFMPADFNPNLVVPVAAVAAMAAPAAAAYYYDDNSDDNDEVSFWGKNNAQAQQQKPAWQDSYAYHGTEKYDEFYNLREDEYREEYGEDFEDAIDDEYEDTYINK